MKKRVIASALTVCMGLPASACAANTVSETNTVYVQAAEYTDVSKPYDPAGMRTLNRLGFVQLLCEASGEDISEYENFENVFSDTNDPSVNWAYMKWLINGNGQSRFRPDDAITREEAAAILGRFLDYKYTDLPGGCGTGAPNMDNISKWAQNDVMKCWMYGVIDTGDKPDFNPKGLMTGEYGKEIISKAANPGVVSAIPTVAENKTFADSLVNAVKPEGNFTLSPYSVRLCLAMLANGAKGETQTELLKALQINDLDAFNKQVKKQLETYDGYSKIMSLETANSIWLNQSWFGGKGSFLPGFENPMKENYRAETQEVTNKNSVEKVNSWVNEKTKKKIPAIIDDRNREFVTALINAVYFKAAWEDDFYEGATHKADFTNADGTKTQVDMMRQTNNFGYYSTPGVEALKMDYRNYSVDNEMGDNFEFFKNADFSMYLMKTDSSDFDVQCFLDHAEFRADTETCAYVPKFKIEYSKTLDDSLKALGVKTAYNQDKADLTAMVDTSVLPKGQMFLDTVLHKTYIAIDEKGTEAAAVTAALGEAGSARPERPPLVRIFKADSPFLFAIRDNTSKEILFVGRCDSFKN